MRAGRASSQRSIALLCQVFAVLGMQLFMGRLASCSNPAILTQAECVDAVPPAMGGRFLGLEREGGHAALPDGAALRDGAEMRRALKGGGDIEWDGTGPLVWQNVGVGSFDDFGAAMRLLYVMSRCRKLPPSDLMGALPCLALLCTALPCPTLPCRDSPCDEQEAATEGVLFACMHVHVLCANTRLACPCPCDVYVYVCM